MKLSPSPIKSTIVAPLFSAMMALQFMVVLWMYPETKGVTLEERQKKLSMK